MVSTDGGPIQSNAVVQASQHPELGIILTELSGRTVYLFTDDERNKSNCLGGCALAWPPFLTVGDPSAGEGVAGDQLGSITRDDGSTQVTYNGRPLYYFAPDEKPGDANGQGVGDIWFVVSAEGEAVIAPVATPTAMVMDHPTPAPTAAGEGVEATPGPPPPPEIGPPTIVQEVSTIENYAASQFFPPRIVVIKDVPLKLYMTRLHSEHRNEFNIEPFIDSRPFSGVGNIGVVEFTPDQSGEFKMHNVGHFFEGEFIVVDSEEEARIRIAEMGVQEFSLIHDLVGGIVTPGRLVVQKDIPVKIYNVGLSGDVRVTIEPLYTSNELNVKKREITTIEFIPDVAGEFEIRYNRNTVVGTLVVE